MTSSLRQYPHHYKSKRSLIRYQVCFTLTGLINNMIYVLVLSSSQDVATHFGQDTLMSLLSFALILPTAGILILNSICLLKVSHKARILCTVACSCVSCLIYAIFSGMPKSDTYAFYICVSVSFLAGACQAMGEGVMIAFVKKFPSECITGWSSGTGLAGLTGAGLYLLLKGVGVSTSLTFYCVTPLPIVYAMLFLWLERNRPEVVPEVIELMNEDNKEDINGELKESEIVLKKSEFTEEANIQLSCRSIIPMLRKTWWSCLNIGLVFFLEYSIITCFADVLNKTSHLPPNPTFFESNAFRILSFCYQIGVFLSRSSMYCFTIRKWHILTAIQAVNFAGWFTCAIVGLPLPAQFIWMVFVGLIGGCSYVNIYYFTLELNTKLSSSEKELAVNLIVLSTDLFTTMATVLALLLSNTMFKDQ